MFHPRLIICLSSLGPVDKMRLFLFKSVLLFLVLLGADFGTSWRTISVHPDVRISSLRMYEFRSRIQIPPFHPDMKKAPHSLPFIDNEQTLRFALIFLQKKMDLATSYFPFTSSILTITRKKTFEKWNRTHFMSLCTHFAGHYDYFVSLTANPTTLALHYSIMKAIKSNHLFFPFLYLFLYLLFELW